MKAELLFEADRIFVAHGYPSTFNVYTARNELSLTEFELKMDILEQVIRKDERKLCAQICRDAGAYKEDIDTYYECADAILRVTDTSSLSDLK